MSGLPIPWLVLSKAFPMVGSSYLPSTDPPLILNQSLWSENWVKGWYFKTTQSLHKENLNCSSNASTQTKPLEKGSVFRHVSVWWHHDLGCLEKAEQHTRTTQLWFHQQKLFLAFCQIFCCDSPLYFLPLYYFSLSFFSIFPLFFILNITYVKTHLENFTTPFLLLSNLTGMRFDNSFNSCMS